MAPRADFVVFHISKYKALGGIGRHIDRKHFTPNVDRSKSGFNEELNHILGKNIDPALTHLKEEFTDYAHLSLSQAVEQRIAAGYTKKKAIRRDAVKALGVILSGTHERMKEIEADKRLFDDWKKANYEFVCREFGAENIVRFTLHLDEKTPHFHCVFVPITQEGGLSAKYFMDRDKGVLRGYQDRYAETMQRFGLKRGIPVELTGRVHLSTKEYTREVNQVAREAKELTQDINIKNALHLNTVRKETADYITRVKVQALENEIKYQYATKTNQSFLEGTQRQTYKRALEEEIKQSLSWIKKEIPLVDFAVAKLSWEIDKQKSTKRDVVLVHPKHGKIIVPTKPKSETGHWIYSWVDKKGGGTLVDLLVEEGWSWKDIKALSSNSIITALTSHRAAPSASFIEDAKEQEVVARKHFHSIRNTAGDTYLTRRGIESAAYQSFSQLRANKQKAVFGLYKDCDKEGQARLCSTINYYWDREGRSKKFFQKSLPRGLAVLGDVASAKTIVVTESPIDALSYRQFHLNEAADASLEKDQLDKTLYLSTCGNLTAGIKKELTGVFEAAAQRGQEVVLALDNDQAGVKMTKELAHVLDKKGASYKVDLPAMGKDWNEALLIAKNPEKEYAHMKGSLAQEYLDTFKTVEHEQSLLHRAGIKEPVYQDTAACKVGSQSVAFGLYQNVAFPEERMLCSTYTIGLDDSENVKEYFHQGLPRGLAILQGEHPAQRIVVTENPIEALVQRQALWDELHELKQQYFDCQKEEYVKLNDYKASPEPSHQEAWLNACQLTLKAEEAMNCKKQQINHTMYLSTCGNLTAGIKKELAQVFEVAAQKGQEIVLAFDDKNEAVTELEALLTEKACTYSVQYTEKIALGLSKAAHSLGVLSGGNQEGDSFDEDEDENKKAKKKGRSIRL